MSGEGEGQSAEPRRITPGVADERFAFARLRTHLALDRTLLAWIRTTLLMVGFGFGMSAFFRSLRLAHPGEQTERLHHTAIGFGIALLSGTGPQRVESLSLRQRWLNLAVVLILTLLAVSGLVALKPKMA